jgi:hypothetical protein
MLSQSFHTCLKVLTAQSLSAILRDDFSADVLVADRSFLLNFLLSSRASPTLLALANAEAGM